MDKGGLSEAQFLNWPIFPTLNKLLKSIDINSSDSAMQILFKKVFILVIFLKSLLSFRLTVERIFARAKAI